MTGCPKSPAKSMFALACVPSCLTVCINMACHSQTDYKPKYRTTAHKVLEQESELTDLAPNYKLLDKIIDDAKRRIPAKKDYSREEALEVLESIADVLLKANFIYKSTSFLSDSLQPHKLSEEEKNWIRNFDPKILDDKDAASELINEGKILLNQQYKDHALPRLDESFYFIDCKGSPLLYLAIGETLGLPLRLVVTPGIHSFLLCGIADDEPIYWEAVSGHIIVDEDLDKPPYAPSDGRPGVVLDARGVLAYSQASIAWTWFSRGDLDRAIENYSKAIQIKPNDAISFSDRGTCWLNKGNLKKALADFDRAISMDPTLTSAYYSRGNARFQQGEMEMALADFDEAIRINPDQALAYIGRGFVFDARGDIEKAIAEFGRSIQLDPDSIYGYYNRGVALAKINRRTEAVADFKRTIELAPENKSLLVELALDYSPAADSEEENSMERLKSALKPDNLHEYSEYFVILACAYAEIGDSDMALETMKESFFLAEDNERRMERDRIFEIFQQTITRLQRMKEMTDE